MLLIRDNIGRKELREYEREFQLNYRPKLCKCYGDDSLSGEHLSEETRAKMSEVHSSRNLSEETRAKMSEAHKGKNHPRSKQVWCEELKIIFSSVGEAVRWLRENGRPKAAPTNISKCCHAKLKTAYGYHWRFD